MNIAFVGSRSLEGHPFVREKTWEILDREMPDLFISGGALGPDTDCERVATLWGVPRKIFRVTNYKPTWENDFKPRNLQIIQGVLGPEDILVAFLDKTSRTKGAAWTAKEYERLTGKKAEVYYLEPTEENKDARQ